MAGQKSPRERRRYPVGTGGKRRPDRAERKREEAQARQQNAAAIDPVMRLHFLDARLGKGVGAKRERARLVRQMRGE